MSRAMVGRGTGGYRMRALCWGVLLAMCSAAANAADPTVDADFPGGNIVVQKIEGDRVDLCQDLRDTEGTWFYWSFRVRGAAGRTLWFRFTKGNVIGVRGPAVSTDGGRTWDWLGAQAVRGDGFTYAFAPQAGDVRFCFAVPYLEANLKEFLGRHAGNPHLRADTLCTTKKGRTVERLHLGKLDGPPKHRALITCRHHCCEMMASWAVEGLMQDVLVDPDHGCWLRENVEFLVVPFVDKDGVEQGDQGKNRKPHDHNRDYLGASIYPSVAAIREFVPKWSGGRLHFSLDCHCPWIRGGGDGRGSNEQIVLVGNPGAAMWEAQQAFGKLLEQVQRGPLVYSTRHNLPHGTSWNNLPEPRSSSRWAALLPGMQMAASLELPYANAAGKPVTALSARAFGQDLARAIRKYLDQ